MKNNIVWNTLAESDEDDNENYFLQPASSPYNLKEKVEEANKALFSDNQNVENRQLIVKFKENLVDFEPDFTDNDASSIETDNENIDYSIIENDAVIYNYEQELQRKLDICNIEDVIEDIESDELIGQEIDSHIICNIYNNDEVCDGETPSCDNINSNFKPTTKPSTIRKIKTNNFGKAIYCKNDCIERLDFGPTLLINKLSIKEKPSPCPLLKLRRRNCCEKNDTKLQQKLPLYTGLRSEYGLSSAQIEKRERRKQINALREQERQRLVAESKQRRTEQNEKIFCEWLKAKRKDSDVVTVDTMKKCRPNIVSLPMNRYENTRPRPKTAGEYLPLRNIKKLKRPHTSPARIFIEVPPHLIKRGINVGDLLITKSNNMSLKKMHVMAV